MQSQQEQTDDISRALQLVYFNARGVVEVSRTLLALGKVEYEDFRYPINFSDFSRPEYDAAKVSNRRIHHFKESCC
jgi:hypothetical protein